MHDRGLVPFAGLPRRTLERPAQPVKEVRDVARVMPHAREALEERGPCAAASTTPWRSHEHGGFVPRDPRRLEPGLAGRPARGLQASAACLLPGRKRGVGGGAHCSERADDRHLQFALREQPRGFAPSCFQRKIPAGSAASGWHSLASPGTL